MLKKRSRLIKFSGFLVAIAPVLALNTGCPIVVGEPNLPKKLKNNK